MKERKAADGFNPEAMLEQVILKVRSNRKRFDALHAPGVAVEGSYSRRLGTLYSMDQWTLSFFTGMAIHAYNYAGNSGDLEWVLRQQDDYRKKVADYALDTMHDLGFLYSLSQVALYRSTGNREAREIGLLAATELAKRFSVNGKYIDAWSRMDRTDEEIAGLMIIDCMMNLPLLFWAWQETGHCFYREVAEAHADTTLRFLVREDHSVRHAFKFHRITGIPDGERNHCGFGVGSAWARGTAWAMYGFAVAYRYTGKAVYLEEAKQIAEFFLLQLPESGIPVWDFRLPPGAPPLVDTSACAIAACALLELSEIEGADGEEGSVLKAGGTADGQYGKQAAAMLAALSAPPYCAAASGEECVLHLAQCGSGQAGAIWGDYFYMEGLLRLMGKAVIFW
ncbi:MAG: glycosyl hydrolase, family 88 [Paenibacillaceae bacterium]|nr:glycosyl hydrolase, family 88 [Paenibacillaceae bacterium]